MEKFEEAEKREADKKRDADEKKKKAIQKKRDADKKKKRVDEKKKKATEKKRNVVEKKRKADATDKKKNTVEKKETRKKEVVDEFPGFIRRPVEPTPSKKDVCIICEENFSKSKEVWLQCNACQRWAHMACTDYNNIGFYMCDLCRQ